MVLGLRASLPACLLAMVVLAAGCATSRVADTSSPAPAGSEKVAAEPTSAPGPTDPAPRDDDETPRADEPGSPPVTPAPDDNAARGWYYTANATHAVPAVAAGAADLMSAYGGRFTGPEPACVYLTFDQGYENGNTSAILDGLERNGVRATFFVTASYIRDNPALVRRMAAGGHVVGNHSATHPSMPGLAGDPAAFEEELADTARAYRDVTGAEMAHIFRPPMGEYSPLSLWRTQALGYESVFWSFAHRDWIVDDQPAVDVTVTRMLAGSHPGAIYLLHGVSSSDAQALDAVIAGLRAQGYRFGTLGG